MVSKYGNEALVRVAGDVLNVHEIETFETSTPKELSEKTNTKVKEDHLKSCIKIQQHGFLMRTREQVANIDDNYTNKWMKTSTSSSHVEGYICAV